jgi:hypothetical protein
MNPLNVERLDVDRYRVSGGVDPHVVDRDAETREWRCGCAGFRYRSRCTHIAAVMMYRERHGTAPLPAAWCAIVDPMTDDEVLELLGPSDSARTRRASGTPPRDELLETIEAETAAVLARNDAALLELEAQVASSSGQRMRAWWLRARAAVLEAP